MQCSLCNYEMSAFETVCSRCQGKGLPPAQAPIPPPQHIPGQYAPTTPGVAPDDAPNFLYALVGFCIPIVGLILYLVDRQLRPQRARSAATGALVSVGLNVFALIAVLVLTLVGSAVTR